jgi:2-hydroxychromene-2-carboxylate isomerase
MSRSIELLFDFASPNVYLAHRVLIDIAARRGAELRIVPCLLGGIFKLANNQSPMATYAQVKGKLDYETLETQRFVTKHKLHEFHWNPHFPINTLLIMRGFIAAQHVGVANAYRETISAAMWEHGEKMDDPSVVERVLTSAGLDSAKLLTLAQSPEVKKELVSNTDAAVQRGVFGLPTIFVGKDMFFGKERLGQVEELLAHT